MKDFYVLFTEELKKIYNIEKHAVKALPYMAKEASSKKLKKVLTAHTKETLKQIVRLEEIAAEFNIKLTSSSSEIIKSILQARKKELYNYDKDTKDAFIIINIQKLKHYEMACYGNLKTFAKHFKLNNIEELLEESSKEEGNLDKKLTQIAEGSFFDCGVNTKARKKCA